MCNYVCTYVCECMIYTSFCSPFYDFTIIVLALKKNNCLILFCVLISKNALNCVFLRSNFFKQLNSKPYDSNKYPFCINYKISHPKVFLNLNLIIYWLPSLCGSVGKRKRILQDFFENIKKKFKN